MVFPFAFQLTNKRYGFVVAAAGFTAFGLGGTTMLFTTDLAPQALAERVAPPFAPPLEASPVSVAAPLPTEAFPFLIEVETLNLSLIHV